MKKDLTEQPDRSLRVPRPGERLYLNFLKSKIHRLIRYFYRVATTDGVEKRVTRCSTGKCWVPVTK